ncbi:MAG: adenosylcobinamide amidohydrolase [Pseudonocardiaceae bacterium]|nr:adenosylcobinamide amidohydrolase [Pseudonocardiaceae bacterium]
MPESAQPTPEHHWVAGHPVLLWRGVRPWLAVSSAVHGGGIGERDWVLNATVPSGYDRLDPQWHVLELAGSLGVTGQGIGLLTAVDVRKVVTRVDAEVIASVTTGVSHPVWAADDAATVDEAAAGTINAVCWLPVRLSEGALVNAVATVAEAKAQALGDAGIAGTGTCTDATALLCPTDGPAEPYGGPRSKVGSALARAAYAAVRRGAYAAGRRGIGS